MPSLFSVLSGWLMTHLVALGFIGFLLVAILARGPLFGLESGSLQVVPSPAAAPNAAPKAAPRVPAAEAVGQAEAPAPDAGSEAASPPPAVAEPQAAEVPAAAADESVAAPETTQRGKQQPVFRPTQPDITDHQQFVPISVAKEPENAGLSADHQENMDALAEPESLRDNQQLLEQARSAFWAGELERAERLYLEYLSVAPTDADTFGELGNLYQSMGRPGDALDAYYEAGIRFKSQGDHERLVEIVELLSETGDPRAAQLGN